MSDLDGDGILEAPNEILQEKHFYPFGMAMEGPWMQSGANNPYQYNGKELVSDFGLNLIDYGARWYDAAVGRFNTVDRFAEKYSPLSGYGYAANNPITFLDVNGDSIDVYSPKGTYLYTYDDGKSEVTGLYFQNSLTEDDKTTYSNGINFRYNDVAEDRSRAQRGDFTFNVLSDSDIDHVVHEGVACAGTSLIENYKAGKAGGSIDFFGKEDSPIGSNTLNITTSAEGGTVAYNTNDYGNYLTGQALRRLGYSVEQAQLGAHINNMVNGPRNYGSRERAGWLDSYTDQRAIRNGYYHYTTKNPKFKNLIPNSYVPIIYKY